MSLLTSLLRKPACGYFKIPSSVRCFIQVSFVLFFLAVKCCLSELLYSFFNSVHLSVQGLVLVAILKSSPLKI